MPKAAKNRFKIGLVQMACGPDPRRNLQRAIQGVKEAARKGASIACLPELFASTYFCQREDASIFDLAEPIPGPITRALSPVARKARVSVIAPVFERRAAGVYHNSVAVIGSDGKITGHYRKMHIPDDPGFYEKYYFTPGDLGFQAIRTNVGPVAPLICWDQWYPEAARLVALQGANVIFYPTAIGWHPHEKERYGAAQRDAWRTIQRGHAIANGVYVAVVNRVGLEKEDQGAGIEFWGASFVADPQGVVIAEASGDREEILIAEVDLKHLENIRRNWPFLRDRRIDAYQGIDRRFLETPEGSKTS
ncbi:MAG TPA: carbon-nitrogen hydrolase [Terriglobia bacterium]|nr:carbon-nitrogen hydrolase [Terriglobia bacterium]